MNLALNAQGYITHWLVSGPACSRYTPPETLPQTWTDQLGYEKALRGVFYTGTQDTPPHTIALGAPAPCGEVWRYYYNNKSWFVDASKFYSLLTEIRMDATTVLCSKRAQTVRAKLWTYAAVDLWLNGDHIIKAQPPVYKPIRMVETELPLRAGENTLYVQLHNLGVRDTRNLFGLQLCEASGVSISLPDAEHALPFVRMAEWLSGLTCKSGVLTVPVQPPFPAEVTLSGRTAVPLQEGAFPVPADVTSIAVSSTVKGLALTRRFELLEHTHPETNLPASDHRMQFYKRLAAEKWEPRGEGIYFSVFNVLARFACGTLRPDDEELLRRDLDFMESRGDCSDFLVMGFFRLLHNYTVSEALTARIKEVLLSFRYWMDETGNDGMCFWSENHALMFYGAQLVAGQLYPDGVFTCSGRTGREQSALAQERCRAWLNDVEQDGVEEFNSASYMPVTLAALLNLVDYAPQDISKRACAVLDSLLRQLCLHVFQQSVISPQGRVYRDVIYPSRQTVQSLLHIVDASLPYSHAENIWDIVFATSKYEFPQDLRERMREDVHTTYTSGNARVVLEKNADYILTSVKCPRANDDAPHWHNLCFDANADKSTNTYVKSLNERFHGTSVFEPGVYGYQQHLWYAAVSNECVVFVNHPGSSVDFDGMRPGYWYGNGIFPAVRQQGSLLGAVYQIPPTHPISFTHTFWPTVKFDESVQEGQWLFGRSQNGYVGLWCSGAQVAFDDALSGCEYRCYDTSAAYLCVCGSAKQDASFDAFRSRCRSLSPTYVPNSGTLRAGGGYALTFVAHENKTQFI